MPLFSQVLLKYYRENLYSAYVKAYVDFAEDMNLDKLNSNLLKVYRKDTTRLDVTQELAKSFYFMRDYEKALYYYEKFIAMKRFSGLEVYPAENFKIASVYRLLKKDQEASIYLDEFEDYINRDQSLYRHLNYFIYYTYKGENETALSELEEFSEEKNFHYWILIFLEMDPALDEIKNDPKFQILMKKINKTFNLRKEEIEAYLESKDLI